MYGRICMMKWGMGECTLYDEMVGVRRVFCVQTIIWHVQEYYWYHDYLASARGAQCWKLVRRICDLGDFFWISLIASSSDLWPIKRAYNVYTSYIYVCVIGTGILCCEDEPITRIDVLSVVRTTPFCPCPYILTLSGARLLADAHTTPSPAAVYRPYGAPQHWGEISSCCTTELLLVYPALPMVTRTCQIRMTCRGIRQVSHDRCRIRCRTTPSTPWDAESKERHLSFLVRLFMRPLL